jgi:hypothetical protein
MWSANVKILGLVTLLLVLGACAPEDTVVPATVSPTRTAVVLETGTAVAQISPTITLTVSSTPAPTQTHTPIRTLHPTNTPQPMFTPTFTTTPDLYVLPAWVSDPAINVLLAAIDERSHLRLSLYNAETGERFDLPINLSEYGLSPRWNITEEGMFIQIAHLIPAGSQSKLIEEINLQTGEVVKDEIPHEFIQGERKIISSDGRYILHIVSSEDLPSRITIIDEINGTEIELTGPFSSYYSDSISAQWSPDGTMLAIKSAHWYDDFAQPSEYALSVYSASGEPIQEYENYFSHLNWSPTSPHKLLVRRLDGDIQIPCILDFSEDAPICLEEIINWRDEQGVKTHQFSWSPDGSKVGFIYWNNETMNNGLCYLNLGNDEIACPVTIEDLQSDNYVIWHDWSPDGRHLVVDINPWGPDSHDGTFTSLAIVSSDGRAFQPLGNSAYIRAWRPSIPTPSEE